MEGFVIRLHVKFLPATVYPKPWACFVVEASFSFSVLIYLFFVTERLCFTERIRFNLISNYTIGLVFLFSYGTVLYEQVFMGTLDVLCTRLNISGEILLFLVTVVFPLTLSVTQNSLIPLENVLLLCDFLYLNIH